MTSMEAMDPVFLSSLLALDTTEECGELPAENMKEGGASCGTSSSGDLTVEEFVARMQSSALATSSNREEDGEENANVYFGLWL